MYIAITAKLRCALCTHIVNKPPFIQSRFAKEEVKSAANDNGSHRSVGTEFTLYGIHMMMCFMIVENLGQDHMILGRDFLKHYDVSVDVARSDLLIRNPAREYTVHTIYKIDQTNSMLRCKITNDDGSTG